MSDSGPRRRTADAPAGGPKRDLFDAFDELPEQPRLTQPIADVLDVLDLESADSVREWIKGNEDPPRPEDVIEVIDETKLNLVLFAPLGDAIIRDSGPDFERLSMLRNDHQVHQIDGGRWGRHYVARQSINDWLAEYFGKIEPIWHFIGVAIVHPDETDVWVHADRMGLEAGR